jgi:glycine/serine hydroxymethyltransferase
VVGPILSAIKIRRVFKALEMAQSKEKLEEILKSTESQEAAIDLIASENHIPKFLAKKLFSAAIRKLSAKENLPNPYKTSPQ